MENIDFRNGISAAIFQTARIALAEIPRQLHATSRRGHPLPPNRFSPRTSAQDRALVDAKIVKIEDRLPILAADREWHPSQWLLGGNPQLANLVTETIGDRWIDHVEDLQQLTLWADDEQLQSRWQTVKQANKQALADYLVRSQGIHIDVSSLFDLQLQPIVEQQRQLLNILYIVGLFNQIKSNPAVDILPRTFIFGNLGEIEPTQLAIDRDGPAPVNSDRAIVELIQALAKVLATDADLQGKLQVVYIPNSAGLTSQMYAAADLTQQIAPAAIEDIDLSQLRAAINGVLSIGSWGKTNYWLQQLVGAENYFGFGLPIPEIHLFKEYGYDPNNYYKHYPEIRQSIDCLLTGYFTPEHPHLCQQSIDTLFGIDEQMILADYIFYTACQARVSDTYRQKSLWTKMSILNVAGVG